VSAADQSPVPAELVAALTADDEARAAFERLDADRRRDLEQWVADTKDAGERERRATEALERLRSER
jgi:uncharacterized protein YdeI (YjbR/CyaY-like superfamily)